MKIQHRAKGYIIEGKGKGESEFDFYMEHHGLHYSYSKNEYKRYRKPTVKKQEGEK